MILGLATCMHFELLMFSLFIQDVQKFADQQDEKVESSEDSTDSEVESHPLTKKFSKKGAKKSVKRKNKKLGNHSCC